MEKTDSSVWYHVSILGRSEHMLQKAEISAKPIMSSFCWEATGGHPRRRGHRTKWKHELSPQEFVLLVVVARSNEVSTEKRSCSFKACSFGTRKGEFRQNVCAKWRIAAALRSFFKEGVDGGGRKHTITIICSNRGHEFARCEELKRRKGGVWRCRAASRNANKGEHI